MAHLFTVDLDIGASRGFNHERRGVRCRNRKKLELLKY